MSQSDKNYDDFEVVDSSSISFIKRGRKSNVDPNLVTKLQGLKPGQALTVRKMALDAKSADYATNKGRVSAQIRNACRAANVASFSIRWSADGVPMVVR